MSDELETIKNRVNMEMTDGLIRALWGDGALTALAEMLAKHGKSSDEGKLLISVQFTGSFTEEDMPVKLDDGRTLRYGMTDGEPDYLVVLSEEMRNGELLRDRYVYLSGVTRTGLFVNENVTDLGLPGELLVQVLVANPY